MYGPGDDLSAGTALATSYSRLVDILKDDRRYLAWELREIIKHFEHSKRQYPLNIDHALGLLRNLLAKVAESQVV